MLCRQRIVNQHCIVQIHVEISHCQLRRPVVSFAVPSHVVLRFRAIPFVDEMEGFAVRFILYRTRHLRLRPLPFAITVPLLPQQTRAHVQDFWRVKVGKGLDNIIV